MSFDLSNYVDVRARIQMFRDKYPSGSLQPADPNNPFKIVQIGDKTFVAYTACAYRTPDDTRPGIGTAWEPVPGRTPYTKDSELMNAETSAWGRAIVAVLAVDRDAPIASADEVRNREQSGDGTVVPMRPVQYVGENPRMEQPAKLATPRSYQNDRPSRGTSAQKPASGGGGGATPKQQGFIRSLATRLELGDADIAKIATKDIEQLSVPEAKWLIDNLLAVQKGEANMVFGDDGSITIVANDGPAS